MTDAADSLWILDLGLEIYDLPGVRLRVGCWTCVDFGFAPPLFGYRFQLRHLGCGTRTKDVEDSEVSASIAGRKS
jgi:hypothetical protein